MVCHHCLLQAWFCLRKAISSNQSFTGHGSGVPFYQYSCVAVGREILKIFQLRTTILSIIRQNLLICHVRVRAESLLQEVPRIFEPMCGLWAQV